VLFLALLTHIRVLDVIKSEAVGCLLEASFAKKMGAYGFIQNGNDDNTLYACDPTGACAELKRQCEISFL
jgi:hypothetical protein